MDVDSLFKAPKLTKGANKRRMPDNPTPDMIKRLRTDEPDTMLASPPKPPAASPDKGKRRAVTVTTAEEEEEEARGSFAPGDDADYFVEEDDEGRFFGGGLTSEQKQILNIFESAAGGDGAQDEDVEELNIVGVRKLFTRFERAINKNQDQRSKYPNDPSKFIDSEADLDSAIKSLLPLAQSPVLAYPELVGSGAVVLLIGLLAHENVDIVIDVVEVIHELTDEDVGGEGDDDEEEETGKKEDALKELVQSFLDNQILELLVQNLARMNETEESDRQGVFHTLGIFENTIGFNPSLATTLLTKTTLLDWLLTRIKAKVHDANRGYASELLAILLQGSRENRLLFGKKDGVDVLLVVLSQYKRKDPPTADEEEFMENIFDTLCSALAEPEIKKLFLEAEGVELMTIMTKEKLLARSRAVKVLDYSMSGEAGTVNCERFVESLGLKTLFSAFMNKGSKKSSKSTPASEDTTHILGILSSLFTNLSSDSPSRIRLLSKFVENEYEKVERLLEVRENAEMRLKGAENEIESERKELKEAEEDIGEEEEDAWYLRRLEGGLFTLQSVDYILGWICMEDDGVRAHAAKMLARKDKSLRDVVGVLKVYRDNVGDEPGSKDKMDEDGGASSQKEILQGLITFLESSSL